MIRFVNKNICRLRILEIDNNDLLLFGTISFPFPEEDYEIVFANDRGESFDVQFDQYSFADYAFGECIGQRRGFSATIPLSSPLQDTQLRCYLKYKGISTDLYLNYGKWAKLSNKMKRSYFAKNGIVVQPIRHGISVKKHNKNMHYNLKYALSLFKRKQYKAAYFRLLAGFLNARKKWHGDKVWLFLDRIESAEENSEFFYRYVQGLKDKHLKAYYILSPNCEAYSELKRKYNVVEYGSFKYKILHLMADISFASVFRLPSIEKHEYIKDLYPTRVYLQHGLVEKDISSSWNRLYTNDRIFITSSQVEYDAALHFSYGFTEREVKLTGMPRYDILYRLAQKTSARNVICFAPTWRKNLVISGKKITEDYPYNPAFRDSEFFQFYNNLINDSRILETMEKHGYRGVLQLHPFFKQQATDFQTNKCITIVPSQSNYEEKFKNKAMVVTDYSSIAFDFAYINSPVVYAQFDKDQFYDHHSYDEGTYDYEQEGYGPVCYNYEDTVNAIVKMIENNCALEGEYLHRRNTFFAHIDDNNCERIYNEVQKLLL